MRASSIYFLELDKYSKILSIVQPMKAATNQLEGHYVILVGCFKDAQSDFQLVPQQHQ